jgi:hypothetical protein
MNIWSRLLSLFNSKTIHIYSDCVEVDARLFYDSESLMEYLGTTQRIFIQIHEAVTDIQMIQKTDLPLWDTFNYLKNRLNEHSISFWKNTKNHYVIFFVSLSHLS